MTRSAALKTTRDEKVREAKRTFILGLLDLSWRLATAFLLPVFVGAAFGRPLVGIAVGLVLSILFIIKLAIDASKVTD
jgi:uncharacterized membrane protein